jgi:hypothetical protein
MGVEIGDCRVWTETAKVGEWMWRLEIVECGLRLRRLGNECVKSKTGNERTNITLRRVCGTAVAVEKE